MMNKKMIEPVKNLGLKSTNCIINLGLFGQVIFLFIVCAVLVVPILTVIEKISKSKKV